LILYIKTGFKMSPSDSGNNKAVFSKILLYKKQAGKTTIL
jgi:hypothetical protein